MKIDVHVHLAGVGTQGSGCWISPGFRERPTFRILRRMHGIGDEQMRRSVDQDWAAMIAERVRRSELDRAVVLGFDGVYDARGEPDLARSQMIVPPGGCSRRADGTRSCSPAPPSTPSGRTLSSAWRNASRAARCC